MPVEEIQRLCDVHTAVFRDTLDAQTPPGTEDGHPVQTFKEENKALAAVIAKIGKITNKSALLLPVKISPLFLTDGAGCRGPY